MLELNFPEINSVPMKFLAAKKVMHFYRSLENKNKWKHVKNVPSKRYLENKTSQSFTGICLAFLISNKLNYYWCLSKIPMTCSLQG